MLYLRRLREIIQNKGSNNIVYFDESGFEKEAYRPHGWAPKGTKVHGDISGNNRRYENLIMAQCGKKWLAPMIFKGNCTALLVQEWLKKMLLPELKEPSVIIMDNAAFHKKEEMAGILEQYGHEILPLPPYSPDFNPIEQSFAILKKRRQYSQKSLDQLVMGNL